MERFTLSLERPLRLRSTKISLLILGFFCCSIRLFFTLMMLCLLSVTTLLLKDIITDFFRFLRKAYNSFSLGLLSASLGATYFSFFRLLTSCMPLFFGRSKQLTASASCLAHSNSSTISEQLRRNLYSQSTFSAWKGRYWVRSSWPWCIRSSWCPLLVARRQIPPAIRCLSTLPLWACSVAWPGEYILNPAARSPW